MKKTTKTILSILAPLITTNLYADYRDIDEYPDQAHVFIQKSNENDFDFTQRLLQQEARERQQAEKEHEEYKRKWEDRENQ